MKQNRTNNNKYILLIFLAIYFLSTGGIFVKLSPLHQSTLDFTVFYFPFPMLTPFFKKSELQALIRKQIATII